MKISQALPIGALDWVVLGGFWMAPVGGSGWEVAQGSWGGRTKDEGRRAKGKWCWRCAHVVGVAIFRGGCAGPIIMQIIIKRLEDVGCGLSTNYFRGSQKDACHDAKDAQDVSGC